MKAFYKHIKRPFGDGEAVQITSFDNLNNDEMADSYVCVMFAVVFEVGYVYEMGC